MRVVAVFLFALLASAGNAQSQGAIVVDGPWSRALPPVVSTGAAYLTVSNHARHADRLVGASSGIASRVEVHAHRMDGGVAKMHRIEALDLPAGEPVTFAPGGLHLMLIGLTRPLVEGDAFELTLEFERAGKVTVKVPVLAAPES